LGIDDPARGWRRRVERPGMKRARLEESIEADVSGIV
jgi:hypothetical protein